MISFHSAADSLLSQGIVTNSHNANRTAAVLVMWQHGQELDFSHCSMRVHRERLRQIGIDIAKPFDVSDVAGGDE